MANQESTAQHPHFQPRPGIQGLATAYLAAQLSVKVEVAASGCWEWDGTDNGKGYGFIDMKYWVEWPERIVQIHRIVYRLCVGPIPEGMNVLHHCDNPPCCRPDHLFLGTNLDNIADKVAKGRQAEGQRVRANHEHLKGEAVVTARVTADQVLDMRRRDAEGQSPQEIADLLGLPATQVQYIVTGKAWAHLPLAYIGDRNFRPCPKCRTVISTRGGLFYRHVKQCGS